jgi:hypothetical protein
MKRIGPVDADRSDGTTACNRREDAATRLRPVSHPPAATTESAPSEPVPTEPEQAESTPVAPAGELPVQAEAPSATGDGCNAEPAQRLVGEVYTPELGEEARVTAGARVERALRPGQIVTMEFRADRLSFTLDEKGRISVSCVSSSVR